MDTLNDGTTSKATSSPVKDVPASIQVETQTDEPTNLVAKGAWPLQIQVETHNGHAASTSTEQCNAAKHWTPKQKLLVQQRAETLVHALKNYLSIVANQSNDRKTREQGLQDARYVLTVLKRFPSKFPFLHLDNLQAVEASIVAVEAETRLFSFGYAAASMTGNIGLHSDGEESKSLPQDVHAVDESAEHIDILWIDGRASGASVTVGETDEFFTKPASNCATTDFHIPHLSEWGGAAKRAYIRRNLSLRITPRFFYLLSDRVWQ